MNNYAVLSAIEYYLPEKVLSNEMLARQNPDWSVDKIFSKTGIKFRRIAQPEECASDLAFHAAQKLFRLHDINPATIDFILLCTQSPDYFLPTTACLLQSRLNISTSAGALDFNLGCSGYIYGLSLAKGLVETGQAKNVLLLTAETYSKYIQQGDKSVQTIFGDGASASLIQADINKNTIRIGHSVFGTDGSGADHLIVSSGAARVSHIKNKSDQFIKMNGPEMFTFTLNVVPKIIERLSGVANIDFKKIDFFVFHQANAYMLEHLRERMQIPKEKFVTYLEDVGNTVSSTIPIALKETNFPSNAHIMLVGFGVGLSWGATLLQT
jgi:3-oxoacyl-[acyl-carrier-protein] synthase-3